MKIEKHPLTFPAAVLFDWDNTLVSTFEIIVKAMNEALEYFSLPPWTAEELRDKGQLSAKDGLPLIFGENWPKALEIFTLSYKMYAGELIDPLPGAESLLVTGKNLNIPMGVISNKRGKILRQEVAQLGWEDFFEVILGSGDLEADKPSPVPVYYALEKMKLSANHDIWFVGDSLVDWQCAQASGCLPIPVGLDNELTKTYPQYVANCIELEKILLKR